MKPRLFACCAVIVATACGSKSPTATIPSSPEPVATPALPDVPFDKLDHDQRVQFMKEKVVPAMAPLFKGHDEKAFAEFGCKTCHGEGAANGEFKMPNPALPKLDVKDLSKFKKDDLQWMATQIKPEMAKLLQVTEFTPDNPTGFGCSGCHTVAE